MFSPVPSKAQEWKSSKHLLGLRHKSTNDDRRLINNYMEKKLKAMSIKFKNHFKFQIQIKVSKSNY